MTDPNKLSAEDGERQLAAREREFNEKQTAFAHRQAESRRSEDVAFVETW